MKTWKKILLGILSLSALVAALQSFSEKNIAVGILCVAMSLGILKLILPSTKAATAYSEYHVVNVPYIAKRYQDKWKDELSEKSFHFTIENYSTSKIQNILKELIWEEKLNNADLTINDSISFGPIVASIQPALSFTKGPSFTIIVRHNNKIETIGHISSDECEQLHRLLTDPNTKYYGAFLFIFDHKAILGSKGEYKPSLSIHFYDFE
ncbi:MAG: hypothetical protein IJV62_04020 [Eggerthellaceae bacterium]|nr:hypothetical protein [Eggerthellaceae bacterium]